MTADQITKLAHASPVPNLCKRWGELTFEARAILQTFEDKLRELDQVTARFGRPRPACRHRPWPGRERCPARPHREAGGRGHAGVHHADESRLMADPTTYVVLRRLPANVAENANAWIVESSNVQATSAEAAIRAACTYDPATTVDVKGPTQYVAVPARSWKPVTVQAVQTTVLKLTESTASPPPP